MGNFLKDNLSLVVTRILSSSPFAHAFVSDSLSDICLVSTKTKETAYFFPLYLYRDKPKGQLFEGEAGELNRIPNFNDKFLEAIRESLGTQPTPEEIFCYIYAVLCSPTYRQRYEEFLKIDFPRIPLPVDYESFKALGDIGKELVNLHLLKHPALQETQIGFPEGGSYKVGRVRYDEETQRVYINKDQYFEGITKEVWEYRIGAYQVMEKYLKDRRKKQKLSMDEINHYMKAARVIRLTIGLQKKIDSIYVKVDHLVAPPQVVK